MLSENFTPLFQECNNLLIQGLVLAAAADAAAKVDFQISLRKRRLHDSKMRCTVSEQLRVDHEAKSRSTGGLFG